MVVERELLAVALLIPLTRSSIPPSRPPVRPETGWIFSSRDGAFGVTLRGSRAALGSDSSDRFFVRARRGCMSRGVSRRETTILHCGSAGGLDDSVEVLSDKAVVLGARADPPHSSLK